MKCSLLTARRTPLVSCVLLLLISAVLLLPQVAAANAEDAANDDDAAVVVLNDVNFEQMTQAATGQTTGKWFVMFYASWCGHCNRLKPIWDEMAQDLKQDDDDDSAAKGIAVAQVDAIKNKLTTQRFSISGFPTLLYFADRNMYKYEGPRQAEELKAWCLSGYKEATALDIPPPPSFVDMQRYKLAEFVSSNDQMSMLVEDFEHILDVRKNAAAVLILIGTIIGFLLGCLVECCTRGRSSKKKTGATKEKAA